jgi:L-ribulokinase
MTGVKRQVYRPRRAAVAVYAELYRLYCKLHDAFGTSGYRESLFDVMKELIAIRHRARQESR